MPNYGQSAQYIPAQAQAARAGFALPPQAQVPDVRAQQLAALMRRNVQIQPVGMPQMPTLPTQAGGVQLPAAPQMPTLPAQARIPNY